MPITALVADILRHNPELAFYQAEIEAAKGERRSAATWQNPEISSQVGQKRVRGGGLSEEGVAWAVTVQQPFEWPGRIPLRKAIANRQVKLAELGLAQFKSVLASRARYLGFGLFVSQEKAAATREVAERFRQLREVLVQRDPAGLTPQLETRIIEASELTLWRKATQAELALREAMLELNQLRGVALSNRIVLQPVECVFPPVPTDADLLAAAATNNFELQMRQVELEQHGLKLSLARKDGYPSFGIGPYYAQEEAADRERQVGIAVSVPLPLWNRNQGSIETAEARRKQAETSLFITQRDLHRRIVQAALVFRTKLEEMDAWRLEAVGEFQKAAELADRHYRLGAVPIATYVELQKQYLEAVEALLDTRLDALEAGQELHHLTGLELMVPNLKAGDRPIGQP